MGGYHVPWSQVVEADAENELGAGAKYEVKRVRALLLKSGELLYLRGAELTVPGNPRPVVVRRPGVSDREWRSRRSGSALVRWIPVGEM